MDTTKQPDPTPYLTRVEAAALCRIKPQTLALWATQGRGPAFLRIGGGPRGKVLYSRADVEAWLASRPRASSTAGELRGEAA